MRATVVALFLSGASAFRSVSAFRSESAEEQFSLDRPHRRDTRRHPSSTLAASGSVVSEIPGYRAHEEKRCAGTWIEFWENDDYALYGQSNAGHKYTQPLECARECNRHAVCAGFYSRHGVCSYWRSGPLQEARHRHAFGHTCYVKWQTENLDDASVVPMRLQGGGDSLKRPQGPQVSGCLCIFDVGRTLTARQGWTHCPGTEEQIGIQDLNHVGGTMLLSDLALGIKESAECGRCYFGIVSGGTAGGPNSPERSVLDGLVEPQFDVGGYADGCPSPVSGTKVMACGRHAKQRAVGDIVAWLGDNGVTIDPHRVHYFDDRARNVLGFDASPFHAHQTSCSSRDGERGGCGGTRAELNNPAQHVC